MSSVNLKKKNAYTFELWVTLFYIYYGTFLKDKCKKNNFFTIPKSFFKT